MIVREKSLQMDNLFQNLILAMQAMQAGADC